jgi:hydroxymethylpyrimidine/phosphomethylpyrimidine kinase
VKEHTPTVLVIAGYDPYGGAGVLADTKTIHALGGYAMCVTTAVTAQNSQGVRYVEPLSPDAVKEQLTALLEDVRIDAVKIGMLASGAIVKTVAETLKAYKLPRVVLDTVLVSSSGKALIDEAGKRLMIESLFGLCTLVTPNLDEVNVLLNARFKGKASEITQMAEGLFALGARNVLIKGGHGIEEDAVDYLAQASGELTRFSHPRIATTHTHGTGCVLSSAIAAGLAMGMSLQDSVKRAKRFLSERLESGEPHLRYAVPAKTRKEPML